MFGLGATTALCLIYRVQGTHLMRLPFTQHGNICGRTNSTQDPYVRAAAAAAPRPRTHLQTCQLLRRYCVDDVHDAGQVHPPQANGEVLKRQHVPVGLRGEARMARECVTKVA